MTGFFSLVEQKLGQRGRSSDWDAERMAGRICEVVDGLWPSTPPPPPLAVPVYDASFEFASDTELIHEMLRRGFAVMRLPEPKEPA
jgi:hypothetical protein